MSQTTKRIRIKLVDGRVYSVSAHAVADHRAKYYAERDKETTYAEEYEFAVSDNYELKDWLFGNMDWYDLDPKLEPTELPELKDADIKDSWVVE